MYPPSRAVKLKACNLINQPERASKGKEEARLTDTQALEALKSSTEVQAFVYKRSDFTCISLV